MSILIQEAFINIKPGTFFYYAGRFLIRIDADAHPMKLYSNGVVSPLLDSCSFHEYFDTNYHEPETPNAFCIQTGQLFKVEDCRELVCKVLPPENTKPVDQLSPEKISGDTLSKLRSALK